MPGLGGKALLASCAALCGITFPTICDPFTGFGGTCLLDSGSSGLAGGHLLSSPAGDMNALMFIK